jgi:site-specific DNA-methyltransferase (cytosine-N4-specific)
MKTNTVYFKDARNMTEVDDNSITLIVTSPPYWCIKDYSKDGYQQKQRAERQPGQIGDISDYQEYLDELTMVWKECERVLEPNGKLCINVPLMPILKKVLNTHYTRDIVNINSGTEQEILKNTALYLMDVYIWNRTNPTKRLMFGSYPYPPNFYAQNTVEFVSVYVKDGAPKRRPEHIKAKSQLTQNEWVTFTKQVWDIPIPNKSDPAYGKHPAIMPEEMARRLIRLYSFVDDIVLDPFLGSGTTAKVAIELGRRWIGYEIDQSFESVIQSKLNV